jgi:SAM-dependent methyltransferase
MTFKEGLTHYGLPYEIPDCSRNGLPQFLVDSGYKVGAEVGVYKAEYSERFAKVGLKHYAIDPWMAFPGQGRTQKVQERQEFLYGHAQRVLAPYPNCTMIRKTSMDALADFADNSLDYVYLDGDHSFRFAAEDIVEWSKKVRPGGIVAGHDYWNTGPDKWNVVCQVKAVLDAYIKVFEIKSFYIYGKMHPLDEQKKDDKFHSWLYIK